MRTANTRNSLIELLEIGLRNSVCLNGAAAVDAPFENARQARWQGGAVELNGRTGQTDPAGIADRRQTIPGMTSRG